jgi:hypothetical protein
MALWKNSLVARFHRRTSSQAPLLPVKGARPLGEPLTSLPENEGGSSNVDRAENTPRESEGSEPTNDSVHSKMATATNSKTALPAPAVQNTPSTIREELFDEANGTLRMKKFKQFLMEEVDGAEASAPLTAYCFMTGFM